MMRRLLFVVVFLGVVGAASPVLAQCSVRTDGVVFGSYDVFAPSPRTSSGTIVYNCLVAVTIQITLSPGNSGTFVPRRMTKGSESLSYNLYRDTLMSQIWGTGAQGTSVYQTVVNLLQIGKDVVVPIYGSIPAGQDVSGGVFTDSITVTINF